MAEGIFFVRQGTLKNHQSDQVAFDSRLDHIKIRPNQDPPHADQYTHKFGATPPDGTNTILQIPHGFSYAPAAIVRRKQEDQEATLFLTTRLENSFFDPIPTIITQEWVWYYYTDEQFLNVIYKQTNGNYGSPGADNIFANTTQIITYEIYANPGAELITL